MCLPTRCSGFFNVLMEFSGLILIHYRTFICDSWYPNVVPVVKYHGIYPNDHDSTFSDIRGKRVEHMVICNVNWLALLQTDQF